MLPQAWERLTAAMRRRLLRGERLAVDLLYPPRCVYCGEDLPRPDGHLLLCARCVDLLGPEAWEGCRRCGAPRSPQAPATQDCGHCRGQRLAFDTVVPLGSYRNELREAVLRTKRSTGEALATVLGRLHALRREAGLRAVQADLVVPVPLHWSRYLLRGTNGVHLLAEQIAAGLGLPLERGVLYQGRNTHLQRNLAPAERIRNVRDAFRLRRGYDLRGTTVLLVDDVLTTGATASEAARVLKRDAAVARVAVAVLARATGGDSW